MTVSKSQPMRPAEIELVDAVNGLQENSGNYVMHARNTSIPPVTATELYKIFVTDKRPVIFDVEYPDPE